VVANQAPRVPSLLCPALKWIVIPRETIRVAGYRRRSKKPHRDAMMWTFCVQHWYIAGWWREQYLRYLSHSAQAVGGFVWNIGYRVEEVLKHLQGVRYTGACPPKKVQHFSLFDAFEACGSCAYTRRPTCAAAAVLTLNARLDVVHDFNIPSLLAMIIEASHAILGLPILFDTWTWLKFDRYNSSEIDCCSDEIDW